MICDTIFVCLPTPMKNNGECDLNILESSLFEINTLTEFEGKGSKTLIIKSTIPPGTTEQLNKQLNILTFYLILNSLQKEMQKKITIIKIEL
jgi:UDP-glucose 6-dehydrogenase